MRTSLLAVLLLLLAYPFSPALAIDCTKPSQPDEKMICADLELKARDERLNETYQRVSGTRDPTERRALLALEKAWRSILARSSRVGDRIDRQFLLDEIDQRREFLDNGEGIGPERRGRLTYFSVDSPALRKRDSWVRVSSFKFATPHNSGERLFNAEMDKTVDYGGSQEMDDKSECACKDQTEIYRAYLSPRFISVSIESFEYNGGTHGWYRTNYVNVDLARGKIPELEDLFDPSHIPQLVGLCRSSFRFSDPDVLEVDVRDATGAVSVSPKFRDAVLFLGNWAFSKTRAEVRFDVGQLGGGEAQGEQFCTLPYADLRAFLKPGRVLPP